VGRVTPIKNCQILLDALSILVKKDSRWRAIFVGDPVTQPDMEYKIKLEKIIKNKNIVSNVEFVGSMAGTEIREKFSEAFASVNMTPAGGMDKVVLESLATGCPAFTSNTAFKNLFGNKSANFIFSFRNISDLVQKIEDFDESDDKENLVVPISEKVRSQYGVKNIVERIFNNLSI